MTEAVVEAVQATKRYREVLGLNAFTASFGPGITGLVGPNGAGKSTLFRVLTGQIQLDAGRISLLGQPVWNTPGKNRMLGYCPDHGGLWGWMGAEDFVRTLLLLDGFSQEEARERAERSLRTVDLWEVRDRRIGTYSKGMRQRVKVAQALAHDPKVLLLDEPLNGTDPLGRAQLMDLFRRLAAAGHHLIISSHVLHEVERLTPNIVMIAHGRALAQGDLHRIRELLDRFPLTVELLSTTVRPLAALLSQREDVSALEFPAPGVLRLRTTQPDAFYSALPEVALREEIAISGVRSLDDSLEAVFRLLARG